MKAYINLYDEYGRSIGAIELFPRIVDYLPAQGQRVGDIVLSLSDMKLYFWDGSTWKGMGVAKLSELIIDVDKDWGGHVIKNLGAPIDSTDAARKAEIDTHEAKNTGVHGVGTGYIAKTSRSDQLPSWYDIPDKPSTFPPEAHTHVRSEITDLLPVARADLEYPTEDVSLCYLDAIDKLYFEAGLNRYFLLTVDSFIDKAIVSVSGTQEARKYARFSDINNYYQQILNAGYSTSDHIIYRLLDGRGTELATESVDITSTYMASMFSISGSTLKAFRDDLSTPKLTVTDTNIVSGKFGVGARAVGTIQAENTHYGARLLPPASDLPPAIRIFEVYVAGGGSEDDDPVRPNFNQLIDTHPDFGNIDKLAVTWGAFDYKNESTMIVVVTGGNPYNENAILEQEEYVKNKNLAVFKPPRDLSEARDLHAQIRKLKEETIAGVHNLAYQVLGYDDLEPLAVADFYDGFVEGIYDAKHIERVPRFDLEKQINRWADKLKLSNVSGIEKAKHMTKLRKFKKQFL